MIGGDLIRGTIDLLVLDSLLDAPSYGYAVSKRIDERTEGRYEIKETTLYSAMRRLEQSGLLESFKGDETQGRPRTYYRVTEAGARHYRDKCDEWRTAVEVVGRFVRED
ncbi:MAG: helix-turn-helix transcriptional regulator [Microbacteriaceae bacterium]|nr:helix-turn-helix transcriptional regulator [Microbacteriaceae bacterium]